MSAYHNNRRLLLVDDNPAIHEDIRKVLNSALQQNSQFVADDDFLFGEESSADPVVSGEDYEIDSVHQGVDALAAVKRAIANQSPYAVAIVDMRMPPGWDGLETVQRLWEVDSRLLVIFCTAFSDYSWQQMSQALGRTDRFVILKKPFDSAEMQQLVAALVERWHAARRAEVNLEELSRLMQQNQLLEQELRELKTTHTTGKLTGAHSDSLAAGTRTLLVDAQPDDLAANERMLKDHGLQVTAVDHPHDAINECLLADSVGEPYEVVIVEMALPDIDGYQFVRKLRDQKFAGKVIALTTHERPGDRDACVMAGCDVWVPKSHGLGVILEMSTAPAV